jgi:Tol biopolymer transport system component
MAADTSGLDPSMVQRGMAGAFQPSWSPDGQWVAFGLGEWFRHAALATHGSCGCAETAPGSCPLK